MEEWRIHRLIETDDETGKQSQIGGGIVRMRIGAVNGPLHMIDVSPVSVKEMQEEGWEDSFVRLQVADRVVWMEPNEVHTFMELLEVALDASKRNYNIAH